MSHLHEKPVRHTEDDRVGDEDDYLDSMLMESFPASDPPSTTPAALGSPNRSSSRRPDQRRGTGGQSSTDVAILRNLGSIVRSLAVIGRARVVGLFARPRAHGHAS